MIQQILGDKGTTAWRAKPHVHPRPGPRSLIGYVHLVGFAGTASARRFCGKLHETGGSAARHASPEPGSTLG